MAQRGPSPSRAYGSPLQQRHIERGLLPLETLSLSSGSPDTESPAVITKLESFRREYDIRSKELNAYLKEGQIRAMPCGKENGGMCTIATALRPLTTHVIPRTIRTAVNASNSIIGQKVVLICLLESLQTEYIESPQIGKVSLQGADLPTDRNRT